MSYGKFSDNAPSPFLEDLPPSVQVVHAGTRSRPAPQSFGPMRAGSLYGAPSARRSVPARAGSSARPGASMPRARVTPARGPRIPVEEAVRGLRVSHVIFGEGVIDSVEGTRATIDFPDAVRILDLEVAPLKKA